MQEELVDIIVRAIDRAREAKPSRANSLAITKLEEALFWATYSVEMPKSAD
jgi:hypothetical protein